MDFEGGCAMMAEAEVQNGVVYPNPHITLAWASSVKEQTDIDHCLIIPVRVHRITLLHVEADVRIDLTRNCIGSSLV